MNALKNLRKWWWSLRELAHNGATTWVRANLRTNKFWPFKVRKIHHLRLIDYERRKVFVGGYWVIRRDNEICNTILRRVQSQITNSLNEIFITDDKKMTLHVFKRDLELLYGLVIFFRSLIGLLDKSLSNILQRYQEFQWTSAT